MSDTGYRSIDIDFEVYQLIVLEKRGFDETDNDAVRRLLGLGESTVSSAPLPAESPGSWTGHQVELSAGTRLRMLYGGVEHTGTVINGKWKIGDKHYNTPSQAASGVARTKSGGKTMLNGWKYWQAKRPSDTSWVSLDGLRKMAIDR